MTIDDSAIDAQQIVAVAARHKVKILIASILFSLLGFAVSFLIAPVYRAEVLLLNSPVERRGGNVVGGLGGSGIGLSALAGLGVGAEASSQEALAVLRSRSLIYTFIEEHRLISVLFEDRSDDSRDIRKDAGLTKSELSTSSRTLADAYEKFDREVRHVNEDRRTGLVTLAIEWTDPQLAAQWASEVVSRANAQLRASAIKQSEKSLTFLRSEAEKSIEVEVKQAIYKLIDSELKRTMFAQVNEDYAFKVIDPPVVSENKIRPKRSLFALLGFMLGAFGALAYLLAAHPKSVSS